MQSARLRHVCSRAHALEAVQTQSRHLRKGESACILRLEHRDCHQWKVRGGGTTWNLEYHFRPGIGGPKTFFSSSQKTLKQCFQSCFSPATRGSSPYVRGTRPSKTLQLSPTLGRLGGAPVPSTVGRQIDGFFSFVSPTLFESPRDSADTFADGDSDSNSYTNSVAEPFIHGGQQYAALVLCYGHEPHVERTLRPSRGRLHGDRDHCGAGWRGRVVGRWSWRLRRGGDWGWRRDVHCDLVCENC